MGRHYIMTSEYVEKVFPEMGVRLICINDDYDSEDTHSDRDGLLMPFKLVMNDTYVKDTARRIQSSIHAKMDSGEYLPSSGSVPYGYRRVPEKGTFEIDGETTPVQTARAARKGALSEQTSLQNELQKQKRRVEKSQKQVMRDYEAYISGNLTKEAFLQRKAAAKEVEE